MAHLPNPNATQTTPTNPPDKPNTSLTGTYQIHTSNEGDGYRCIVYRGHGWRSVALTVTRGRTEAAAVSEARRNVRNARKAGGL